MRWAVKPESWRPFVSLLNTGLDFGGGGSPQEQFKPGSDTATLRPEISLAVVKKIGLGVGRSKKI